jgi:hypothetical protein
MTTDIKPAEAVLIGSEGPLGPLYAAIARATARAQPVGKDAENEHHRYRYASAESLIEEARTPLALEGLCVIPTWDYAMRDALGGGKQEHFADVTVIYRVGHADGGSLTFRARTPAIRDRGRPEDKAVATALTYNLGYFLRGLLMLPRVDADHDVDQRDDRDYEPAARRGRDDWGHDSRQPAAPREDALKAIAAARNLAELERLLPDLQEMADGGAKELARAAYVARRKHFSNGNGKPSEPAPAGPAGQPTPADAAPPAPAADVDPVWLEAMAEIGALAKVDASMWALDDLQEEWSRRLGGAGDKRELNALAPWLSAIQKHGAKSLGCRKAAVAMASQFNGRTKELSAGRREA